jgi:WD40 repeat protein
MDSFEKIRHSLKCQICDLIYKQPIKLPCGKSICKSHLLDLNGSLLNEFYCKLCQSKHKIPLRGFHPNFFIQNQINTFQHLSKDECDLKSRIAQSIENLKASYDEIEEVEQEYLQSHFQDIEYQIMEYRELLLKSIADLTDKMLKETRNHQSKVKSKLTQLKISKDKDLNQLKTDTEIEFRQAKINKSKLETDLCNINDNALYLNRQLIDLVQNDLKPFTFLNKLKPLADQRARNILLGISPKKNKEGLKIISCYKNGSIGVRDLLSDESQIEFFNESHETDVNCILLSSDNQKLISGDKKGTIKVWDVRTGELLRTVYNVTSDGEKRGIKCMIFSSIRPNEILISSAFSDIRILDLNSYIFTLSLQAHARRISSLEFFTQKILVSSSSDLTIKIWNLDSTRSKCLQTIECAQNEPRNLRKINETKFACLFDNGLIKIFHSDKESILFKCYKTISYNSGYHRDLKVCSDLNLLICASKVIHFYSLSDFTCVRTLFPNTCSFMRSMEILPNNRLIVANDNNTLELWCLKTGQSLSIHKDHSSLINGILFYLN